MLFHPQKKRSLTARLLLGGLICAGLVPFLVIQLFLFYLRWTRPLHSDVLGFYEVPARVAEQLIKDKVAPDLVDRIEKSLHITGGHWLDVWIVDSNGTVLSRNSADPIPIQPERYRSLSKPKPHFIWELERSGLAFVVRPLRTIEPRWMLIRLRYFGSYIEKLGKGFGGYVLLQSLLTVTLVSGLVLLYFRMQGKRVRRVLTDLKSGDLRARFQVDKIDELGTLMLTFNEMADEIAGLLERVRESEKTRTELLQFLAHDIRTPLTTLRLLAEDFEEGTDPKKQSQARLLLQELAFLERMTEDIFFLARITDRPSTASAIFSVDTLLSEECDRQSQLSKKQIVLSAEVPHGLYLKGQEALFRRAVRNILNNATKYARNRVDISVVVKNEGVVLRFLDDGPGLTAEAQTRFGQRNFVRYRTGAEKNADISLGLGSVIACEVARVHGGECRVRNSEIGGAEVTLSLPLSAVEWRNKKPDAA